MTTPVATETESGGPRALHFSASARSRWRTAFLLSPPLVWFLVIYISSLVLMLITSFWSVNSFTSQIQHQFTGANFAQITSGAYVSIIERTVLLAALVTITDAIVAFPFAYVMARIASRRTRRILP